MFCSTCGAELKKDFKFCQKCGQEKTVPLETNDNSFKNNEKIEFFIVPTLRLIVFSILSFGFYSLYWFALNFNAIEKRRKKRGKKTHSTLWGIFNTLTSEILFRELDLIKKETTGKGFKISPAVLGVIYFVFMVFGGFVLLSPFVFIATVLIFQKKVKDYSSNGASVYKQAKFNWREIIIVLVGLLFFISSLFSAFIEESNKQDLNESFDSNILQSIVDEINLELPQMIDTETRLDYLSVIGLKTGIDYHYTLVNLSKSDLEIGDINDMLGENVKSFVCESPDMSYFIDNELIIKYSYYDKNNTFIESIVLDTKTECISPLTNIEPITKSQTLDDGYSYFRANIKQDSECNIEKNFTVNSKEINLSAQESDSLIIISFTSGRDIMDVMCPQGYAMTECAGGSFNYNACRGERYNYDEINDRLFCEELNLYISCEKDKN